MEGNITFSTKGQLNIWHGSGSGGGTIDELFYNARAVRNPRSWIITLPDTKQIRIGRILSKDGHEKVSEAWAKWCHASDIAGTKVLRPYIQGPRKLTEDLVGGAYSSRVCYWRIPLSNWRAMCLCAATEERLKSFYCYHDVGFQIHVHNLPRHHRLDDLLHWAFVFP